MFSEKLHSEAVTKISFMFTSYAASGKPIYQVRTCRTLVKLHLGLFLVLTTFIVIGNSCVVLWMYSVHYRRI